MDLIEAPYPLALMLCDASWEDPATGKRTILGSFSYLQARSFPALYPVVGVYAAITERPTGSRSPPTIRGPGPGAVVRGRPSVPLRPTTAASW